jgi:hypothetical protein
MRTIVNCKASRIVLEFETARLQAAPSEAAKD